MSADMGVSHPTAPLANPVPELEVAHVLFMDIVGYGKLSIDAQTQSVAALQAMVQQTTDFQIATAKSQIICRPTGDGMAIIFLQDMLAPLRCAIEISRAIRRMKAPVPLRMGINSGPIYVVKDINARDDVQGDGIVMAQRIMDCGDAGHILLTSAVAQFLSAVAPWSNHVREAGTCEIKHGKRIAIFNLYGSDFGERRVPRKAVATLTTPTTPLYTVSPPPVTTRPQKPDYLHYSLLVATVLGSLALTGVLVSIVVFPALRQKVGAGFKSAASAATTPEKSKETLNGQEENKSRDENRAGRSVSSPPKAIHSGSNSAHHSAKSKSHSLKNNSRQPPVPLPTTEIPNQGGSGTNPEDPEPNVQHTVQYIVRIPSDMRDGRMVRIETVDSQGNVNRLYNSSSPLDVGDEIPVEVNFTGSATTLNVYYINVHGEELVWSGNVAGTALAEQENHVIEPKYKE